MVNSEVGVGGEPIREQFKPLYSPAIVPCHVSQAPTIHTSANPPHTGILGIRSGMPVESMGRKQVCAACVGLSPACKATGRMNEGCTRSLVCRTSAPPAWMLLSTRAILFYLMQLRSLYSSKKNSISSLHLVFGVPLLLPGSSLDCQFTNSDSAVDYILLWLNWTGHCRRLKSQV